MCVMRMNSLMARNLDAARAGRPCSRRAARRCRNPDSRSGTALAMSDAVRPIWQRRAALIVGIAALAAATPPLRGPLHGLSLVVRAADVRGAPRWAAELTTSSVIEWPVRIPVEG